MSSELRASRRRSRFHVALWIAVGLICLLPSRPLVAQVVDADAESFTIELREPIAASPGEVWDALLAIGSWWNPEHTFHGADALVLEPRAGGCFCERTPEGQEVLHLQVINVNPGSWIWFAGGLGPLQAQPVTGRMTWTLATEGEAAVLTLRYRVAGRVADGLDTWAEPVAGVLAEQLERLRRFVETGSPS